MALFDFLKNSKSSSSSSSKKSNTSVTGFDFSSLFNNNNKVTIPKAKPFEFPKPQTFKFPKYDGPKLFQTKEEKAPSSSSDGFIGPRRPFGPQKNTAREPVPAKNIDEPTTDVVKVQNAVRQATTPTRSGFNASATKVALPEQTKDNNNAIAEVVETPQPTVRDQIEQGMLALLGKDNTDEKQQIREEAQLEAKARTANRVLNELRSIRVDFEARKDELENTNESGRSMGAINNEINKLTKDTNRNLAYKSIEYDIANNDFATAEATVNARIQDMKDEDNKQIQMYKTLYDFVQNDMSESEKVQAQQAFQEKQAELQFERQKEMADYNSLLRRREASHSMSLKSAVTSQEAQKASQDALPTLNDKAGQIKGLIADLGKNDGNVVGPNSLARISLTRGLTGNGQNFIAGVEQLVSRETLDTLVNLKARGGTLGALSEKELQALEASASKIGTWRITDDNNNVKGYRANEADFKRELKNLEMLTNRAILSAGGSLNEDPLGLGVGGQDPLALGI